MSKPRTPLPPISSYPNPSVESIEYVFRARPGFINDRGNFWHAADVQVEEPTLDYIADQLAEIKDPANSQLSWIEFYQRAAVSVRHPGRFDGDSAGPNNIVNGAAKEVERVYGDAFVAASPQLVTGASETGFTFATVQEILDTGSITPFMTDWLARYSQRDHMRGFNKFLIPLLPIVEPKIADKIRKNKFSDVDFKS